MAEKKIKLTEKSETVLDFLKTQEEPMTGKQIADRLGINDRAINGILSSLIGSGRELVAKDTPVKMMTVNSKGLRVEKNYVTYVITQKGLEFETTE